MRASKWRVAWPDSADMVFVQRLRIPVAGILGNSSGIVRVAEMEGSWRLALEVWLGPVSLPLRALRTERAANAGDKEPWDGHSTAQRRIPETSEGGSPPHMPTHGQLGPGRARCVVIIASMVRPNGESHSRCRLGVIVRAGEAG